jgi:hypothetical protein
MTRMWVIFELMNLVASSQAQEFYVRGCTTVGGSPATSELPSSWLASSPISVRTKPPPGATMPRLTRGRYDPGGLADPTGAGPATAEAVSEAVPGADEQGHAGTALPANSGDKH